MDAVQKLCCMCNRDVADKKRVKDQKGRYYCQSCYEVKLEQQRPVHAREAVAAQSASGGGQSDQDPYDFPNTDGEIGLAEVVAPPPVMEEMFGCADCKKVVAKRQIRNDDGEFVCLPCFNKRRASTGGKGAEKPVRKSFAEEDGQVDGVLPFTHTLHGGAILSASILVFGWVLFLCLGMMMPDAHRPAALGILYSVILASVETVFLLFRGFALIVSMFIAAKLLGGCDFGYLGSAIWKALAVALVFTVVNVLMAQNESLMMLGFGIRGIIFVLTFIIVFRLDRFEAMVLSIVNFIVFWGLTIAMGVVLLMVMRSMAPHHNEEFDEGDGPPAVVQPHGAAPGPAAAPVEAPAE